MVSKTCMENSMRARSYGSSNKMLWAIGIIPPTVYRAERETYLQRIIRSNIIIITVNVVSFGTKAWQIIESHKQFRMIILTCITHQPRNNHQLENGKKRHKSKSHVHYQLQYCVHSNTGLNFSQVGESNFCCVYLGKISFIAKSGKGELTCCCDASINGFND